jgi:hypothetical protein
MSEDDPLVPSHLQRLQQNDPKFCVGRKERIRIGTLSINPDSPLNSPNGNQLMHRLSMDHIKSLQAFAPHLQLDTAQGGIQGCQYIVPQFILGWKKIPGHTEKQNLLNPSNNALLPELTNLYGLEVSLCTGLMYRVPLQILIGQRILPYVRSRGPPVEDWIVLEQEWNMSNAFCKSDLQQWFSNLPAKLHAPAWMLVKEILNQLQHTGVDHEHMLRIAWLQPNDSLKCLKIKCSRANSWAKILIDSPNVVTFAYVASECVSPSRLGNVAKASQSPTIRAGISSFILKCAHYLKTTIPCHFRPRGHCSLAKTTGLVQKT